MNGFCMPSHIHDNFLCEVATAVQLNFQIRIIIHCTHYGKRRTIKVVSSEDGYAHMLRCLDSIQHLRPYFKLAKTFIHIHVKCAWL